MSSGYQVFTFLQSENGDTISFFSFPRAEKRCCFTQTLFYLRLFSLCWTRKEGQREQRAGSGLWGCILTLREFESCSHEYHHLLGSEVTGNFCRDCMRFAWRNSPLSDVFLLLLTASLGPCAHTHFLCQATCCCSEFLRAGLFYECSCINHYLQFKFKLTG